MRVRHPRLWQGHLHNTAADVNGNGEGDDDDIDGDDNVNADGDGNNPKGRRSPRWNAALRRRWKHYRRQTHLLRRSEPRKIERLFTLVLFLHQIHAQANVQYKDKEDELSALSRRIMLLETESNGADVKLAKTTMEVSIISQINDISFKYAINAIQVQSPIESLRSNLLRISL